MGLPKEKHHLHIELTAEQYQRLCQQAKLCGLCKRAYIVRLIDGTPIRARPSQEIKDLRTEIHHIGNILEPDDPDFEEKFQQLEQRGALFRVNHRSWWAEELPSEAEYLEARANLERVHWNVDYIISHCCPSSIQDVFSGGMFKKDALTEFFDEVCQRCTFRYWFFGHYHSNMVIEKKYAMLYEQIIRLK